MRYSRMLPGEKYLTSTAVATHEVLKLLTCFVIIAIQENGIRGLFRVKFIV